MIKIDLHTHSILSHDGSIDEQDYKQAFDKGILSYVAITDHDRIEYAQFLQKKFGERIIVGEEMYAKEGHIIGLFLQKTIASGQSTVDTIAAIKEQGGLVYIPHPFDVRRKGIGEGALLKISNSIDILEVFNGRILVQEHNKKAKLFAQKYNLTLGVGSDAHCRNGLGTNYSELTEAPTKENLVSLLRKGMVRGEQMALVHFLCPKINKLKKMFI